MCLRNIHDFGHSKEPTQLMSTNGTSLGLSPQYERLHQDFEKSRNYQIGHLHEEKEELLTVNHGKKKRHLPQVTGKRKKQGARHPL
ncbi:hypothetical protein ACS0TY_031478 [Phlomoides rotata]